MIKSNLDKIKGYVGLANRANYVIFGADNLKGYSHKLYLVIYREDFGKTIYKTIQNFKHRKLTCIVLNNEEFNYITGTTTCKLFAIKNKGISEQIINILRSENFSG